MKGILRKSGFLIGGLGIILALGIGMYDYFCFQPHMNAILTIVSNATPSEKAPPDLLAKYVRTTSGSLYAASLIRDQIGVRLPGPGLGWRGLLWNLFVAIHLTEAQRFAVTLSLSPKIGDHVGAAEVARFRFQKDLAELSPLEAGEIACLIQRPTMDQEKIYQQAKRLVERNGRW